MSKIKYNFPIVNKFHARTVTELNFEIADYPQLYVDLDEVRDIEYREEIKYSLNIEDGKLQSLVESPKKTLFSGHKGSGKTVELRRLAKELDHSDRYFTILIELEKEALVSTFQSDDLFVLFLVKLIDKLKQENINYNLKSLAALEKEWLSDEEVKSELIESENHAIETEMGGGFDWFLSFALKYKNLFSSQSKTSKIVRESVRKNTLGIVGKLNAILEEVRELLIKEGKAQDILFIFDGSEKIRNEVYRELFIDDYSFIDAIKCSAIFSVPISTFFAVEDSYAHGFYAKQLLPMLRLDKSGAVAERMREIITKRIDEATFFETKEKDGVSSSTLDYLVMMSGGSIRQLLLNINESIMKTLGKRINFEDAHAVMKRLGREMYETLTTEQRQIVAEGNFIVADKETLKLLYSLVLLKYNGTIRINPLLQQHLETIQEEK